MERGFKILIGTPTVLQGWNVSTTSHLTLNPQILFFIKTLKIFYLKQNFCFKYALWSFLNIDEQCLLGMIFKKNQLLDNTPPPLIQRYTSMHKFIFTEILYQCDHLGLVEVYFLLVSKIKLKKILYCRTNEFNTGNC